MGMYNGVSSDGMVSFGSRADVCVLSARDLAVSERIDIAAARNKLKGKLEGQRIVKFRQSGADIVISLDYIHKLADKYPLPKKEVFLTDESEGELPTNDEAKESE